MNTKRFLWMAISLIALFELAVGCTNTANLPTGKDAEWTVVIIGDSSMWEHGVAIASQIQKDLGVKVVLEDFALPALRASSVREVLETGKSSNMRLEARPDAVGEAEVVVMFTNPLGSVNQTAPLDMEGCFSGVAPGNCSMDTMNVYISDLQSIWGKIIELRKGQATILIATDIYNPLVNYWNKAGIHNSCDICWSHMSAANRQAAEAYNIPFISRYDAFNGPDHREDPCEKGYIRDDGEHPTSLLGEAFAKLLADLGYAPYQPAK
jgi:hypothetical protein